MISFVTALLAALGLPLFIAISALAMFSFYVAEIDLTVLSIEMYRIAETPTLTAIPLFAFAGFILAESKAANRLVACSKALLGWLPGGLGIMALVVCALFTSLTGASGMTIVALGGLLYPALQKAHYDERFSLGLLTTSGSLGLLFPPSLPLIIYGIVAQTPIDDLFIAGILPGLLLVCSLSLYAYIYGRRHLPPTPPADSGQALARLRESFWELILPFIVLGGIFSGIIALSEAAVLCATYVLIVEMCIKREVALGDLPRIIRECMVLVGGIFIILAAAMAYTSFLIDAQIPNRLLDTIAEHIESKLLFLILLNVFLLVVGCTLDMFSALILVVPLVLPIAQAYEVHPVHLGIIFLTNLEIGYSTPPVGLNLFIASMRFNKPILTLYIASLPYLAIMLICLILVTYLPSLSLFFITP